MGKQENEVVIKFHKQASELHLKNISTKESNCKNISTKESNCLLNVGGLNCVLATAYQSKSDTTISGTKHKN
jgi:hypothetical protein